MNPGQPHLGWRGAGKKGILARAQTEESQQRDGKDFRGL